MRHEDLRLFLAIAETRNMRRAAEQLGTTQSALTKAMRRLETELRTRLFDRAPRGVELTEPGRSFHARVRAVDAQLSQALHELDDMRMGELGLVRFGCTAANFETIANPVLQQLVQSRPQARFALTLDISSRLIDLLLQGQLDLVVAGAPAAAPAELEHLPLHEETLHAVVRSGHPLLRAKAAPADLAGCRWLLPPPGRITRRWIERRLHELGLPPPRIAVETDATVVLLSPLLRSTDLVAPMTRRVLASPAGAGLKPLDRLLGGSADELVVFWRRGSYLSPLAQDFRAALQQAAARTRT